MSWYFFGGFSAYFSVPSGRRWNHSGCSFSHGWSGEHWIAKSSAISIPSFFASATSARNSFSLPSDGSIASCPPSFAPIAQGLPASPGSPLSEVFRPFRVFRPLGWVGGRERTAEHAVDVHRIGRGPRLLGARAFRRGERYLDGQLLVPEQHRPFRQLAGEV